MAKNKALTSSFQDMKLNCAVIMRVKHYLHSTIICSRSSGDHQELCFGKPTA